LDEVGVKRLNDREHAPTLHDENIRLLAISAREFPVCPIGSVEIRHAHSFIDTLSALASPAKNKMVTHLP
jgi:hypothetical protein